MTNAELFELLHLARRRVGPTHVTVRAAGGRGGEQRHSVRLFTGEDADALHRPMEASALTEWQQCAFDPNVVIPELWLEPLDETVVAGRRGIRVRGRRRPTSHDYIVLPASAHEWELVVDIETGILLRLAGLKDGQEATVFEIEEITFDR